MLRAHETAAIVVAAGRAARFKGGNKLLAPLDGKPVIAHVVAALMGAGIGAIHVVTGWQAAKVEQALARYPVSFVPNPSFATGMASSIRAGLAALPGDFKAVLVALGDMPRVTPGTIAGLIGALSKNPVKSIAIPVHGGRRGNPVLWRRDLAHQLAEVTGDRGGQSVIAAHPGAVLEVAVDDPGVVIDVDTRVSLDGLRKAP